MKYIAREQIKKLFNNSQETMLIGLWFSGYKWDGEYKEWWDNGKLHVHLLFKNGKVIKGLFS